MGVAAAAREPEALTGPACGTWPVRADLNLITTGKTLNIGTGKPRSGKEVNDSCLDRFGRESNKKLLESYRNS